MINRLASVYQAHLQGLAVSLRVDGAIQALYTALHDGVGRLRYRLFWHPHILRRAQVWEEATQRWSFGRPERIHIEPVGTVFDTGSFRRRWLSDKREFALERPFVVELPSGMIMRRSGDLWTEDARLVLDAREPCIAHAQHWLRTHEWRRRARQTTADEGPTIDRAVAFTGFARGEGTGGYFAWVHRYLTRLQGLEVYTAATGHRPHIIVPADAPSYVTESLAFFGYEDVIVEWDRSEDLRIHHAVIPSHRFPERFSRKRGRRDVSKRVIAPDAAAWLHEKARRAVDRVDIELSPRVLISRADVGRREIANRDEVEAYLAAHGFVTYELARMSFTEQAALFAQAEHVVGVTGAGMTNMLFSEDCSFSVIYGDVLAPAFY